MRAFGSLSLVVLVVCAAARASPPDRPAAQSQQKPEDSSELEKSALEEMLEEDDAAPDAAKDATAAPSPAARPDPTGNKSELASTPAGESEKSAKASRRGEISEEISGANAQSTPQVPRAGQLSNNLRGSIYLSDAVTVLAGLTLTLESGASPPLDPVTNKPTLFQASYGGTIALGTVGVDLDLNDHWSLGVHFDGSPSAQQYISTTLDVTAPDCKNQQGPVNALINTHSSSVAVGGSAGYDTAGDSNVEFALTASATATDLIGEQQLSEGQCTDKSARGVLSSQTFTLGQFRAYCAAHPLICARRPGFRAVLSDQTFSVLQTRAGTVATVTLYGDTDLSLGGDYYFYSDDPSTLGFFSVRARSVGGEGVAIAPLQWMLRPELVHRFGKSFSARVWVTVGEYVASSGGGSTGLGTKLQYKFTRTFRMWISLSGQKDIDVDGNGSNSGTIALGAAYKF